MKATRRRAPCSACGAPGEGCVPTRRDVSGHEVSAEPTILVFASAAVRVGLTVRLYVALVADLSAFRIFSIGAS
jgi:hypothetical protein